MRPIKGAINPYAICRLSTQFADWCFQPFLAPSKGKDKFDVAEAIHGRGIARNRYVVEITYKRVKEWHLLKEVIPVEKFHVMNSTWMWAQGFAILAHDFLQPPRNAESAKQRARREAREATDARDAEAAVAALRAAAEAARAATLGGL